MALTESEILASLRVLVAMARADHILTAPEERAIEEAALASGIEGVNVKTLFGTDFDLDAELAKLVSAEAKKSAYESAYALAHADETCTIEEEALLTHIETRLGIGESERSLMKRLLEEAEDTVLPGHIAEIVDPDRRSKEIAEDTLKYAILSAALGAFPIPGLAVATDLAVTALQVKLVRDVAQYFGRSLDKKQAAELVAGASLGMGIRIALSNLAKLVPGWGSAVGGASAFVATFALGTVAKRYFESGGTDATMLATEFQRAKQEAKEAYASKKDAVDAKRAETKARVDELGAQLREGKISKAEYEQRIEELA